MRLARPVVAAALLLPALSGCGGASAWLAGESAMSTADMPPSEAGMPLVGRRQWHGDVSRAQSTAFLVARTEAEWKALWDLVGKDPPGALPDKLMALGVFIGTRTSTGYGVDIQNIRLDSRPGQRDRLLVEYREKSPPEQLMVAQMLTSPYAIILVDQTDAPVRYAKLPDEPRRP
ncbi:protease complex subunit PrcB family protein [Aerophototrophica crusticola]|uniref:Protease complex subunit PrcB family protein n=1 Tax=Aerophototrophica crusticola TaxID=1709002 RepID=A0A858R6W1_9PROT|nr:protease complex subunit PrcB family protein [Rhodospirillaceae bacterium B3]